jgi:AAA+ superfamily predicted ATPase
MAANVLAKELGKKLLMVRYDQIQNMYVGETEKHIQRIFKIASVKNAVLFFDEADAIALDRAFLQQSWEMSQVNTLLKELERFEGVCIFATNFAQKYDPAFERRLTMHIDFKMPDKEQCSKILEKLIPTKSREKNLCLNSLLLEGFSGGDLKNVALNTAGIAAKEGADKIGLKHIQEAINMARETKKCNHERGYLG